MIWEVDENLDNRVDWEEFKLMYKRNMEDETGLEPFQLFNVVSSDGIANIIGLHTFGSRRLVSLSRMIAWCIHKQVCKRS